jgi:hypothetical protein
MVNCICPGGIECYHRYRSSASAPALASELDSEPQPWLEAEVESKPAAKAAAELARAAAEATSGESWIG